MGQNHPLVIEVFSICSFLVLMVEPVEASSLDCSLFLSKRTAKNAIPIVKIIPKMINVIIVGVPSNDPDSMGESCTITSTSTEIGLSLIV